MNSIEQAVRAALAKGDDSDQAFRRRIYGSASAALERSLQARSYSETESAGRRQSLLSTIRLIESEYVIAVEDEAPVQANTAEAFVSTQQTIVPIPRAEAYYASENLDVAPVEERPSVRPTAASSSKKLVKPSARPLKMLKQQKSRPWFKYAINGAFLLAVLVGGFWVYGEGKRIYAEATTSKPATQKPALAESGEISTLQTTNWIQVFTANDTDLLSASPGSKAEIINRDGLNYVLMTGDGSNEVTVKIGSGLMQTFAGKRVLFNFLARSGNNETLDTGAHCQFGSETKCDRKRFRIGPETAEYMFAVDVASSASGDGALLIAPDLNGSGGAVEIENIRATIVEADAG